MWFEYLSSIGNTCQALAGLILLVTFIPQWLSIVRKEEESLNKLNSWLLWFFSSLMALIYSVIYYLSYQVGFAMVISYLIINLSCLFTCLLIVRTRFSRKKGAFSKLDSPQVSDEKYSILGVN